MTRNPEEPEGERSTPSPSKAHERVSVYRPDPSLTRDQCERILQAVGKPIVGDKERAIADLQCAAKAYEWGSILAAMPSPAKRSGHMQRIERAAKALLDAVQDKDWKVNWVILSSLEGGVSEDFASADPDLSPEGVHRRLTREVEQAKALLDAVQSENWGVNWAIAFLLEGGVFEDFVSTYPHWPPEGVHRRLTQEIGQAIEGVRRLCRWAMLARTKRLTERYPKKLAPLFLVRDLASAYQRTFGSEPGISRREEREPYGPFIRFLSAAFKELGEDRNAETLAGLWREVKESAKAR